MPISIVVGGQYGSEGKGKIAHWLAKYQNANYAVRVGGPNSGHTAISDDKTYALRQLPTPQFVGKRSCSNPGWRLFECRRFTTRNQYIENRSG